MSSPMPAARKTDPVAHTSTSGALVGALVGAAAALGAVALFATGPVGWFALATYVIGGASIGKSIGDRVDDDSEPNTDEKIQEGAQHVFTNNLRAAKAHPDTKVDQHSPDWVCEGAEHVFIEGWNASRKGDKTSCEGTVHAGSPDTHIGGKAVRAPMAPPVGDEERGLAYTIVDRGLAIGGLVTGLGNVKSKFDAAMYAVDVASELGLIPDAVDDWLFLKDIPGLRDVPGIPGR